MNMTTTETPSAIAVANANAEQYRHTQYTPFEVAVMTFLDGANWQLGRQLEQVQSEHQELVRKRLERP